MLDVGRDELDVVAILKHLIGVKEVDEQLGRERHPRRIRQVRQFRHPTGGKAVQVMLCTGFPFKNPGASSHNGVEISVLKMGMVDTSTWCGKRLVLLQLFTSCTTKVTMYSPGSL